MTPQGENGKFLREGVRKMRLFLIDEDESFHVDPGLDPEHYPGQVYKRVMEHRLEIGTAEVEQGTNGGLIIDLFMAGQWTDPTMMSESLNMKGFIRAEMRKD